MTHLPAFGAIADDLTGGIELAAMLIGQGARCAFVTDLSSLRLLEAAELDAIVVALKIRIASVDQAVQQADDAAEILRAMGVRQIFYKYCATFDSTDQGNIGPIADRLAERLQAPEVLFCPAFPDVGVTIYAGHQFRHHTLMSQTAKRFDPVTPMTDPNLCAVLARQSRNAIGLLAQFHILNGAEAVRAEIAAQRDAGHRFIIADTIRNADLRVLAEVAVDAPLLTGNSSVAEYLPALWRDNGWSPAPAPAAPLSAITGPSIVLAGSCAEQTLAQLGAFEAHGPVLRLDPRLPVDQIVNDARVWVRTQNGTPCAIATSSDPNAVRAVQDQFGRVEASARVDEVFARLSKDLKAMGVRRFLIAGGETAGTVVKALDLGRLKVAAYTGPGPGLAVSLDDDPVALCLKSGKLGARDMMWATLEQMAGRGMVT